MLEPRTIGSLVIGSVCLGYASSCLVNGGTHSRYEGWKTKEEAPKTFLFAWFCIRLSACLLYSVSSFSTSSIGYPLEQNIALMSIEWVIHRVGFLVSSPSEGLSLKVLSKVHVTHWRNRARNQDTKHSEDHIMENYRNFGHDYHNETRHWKLVSRSSCWRDRIIHQDVSVLLPRACLE